MTTPNPNLHTKSLLLRPAIPFDAPSLAVLFANPLNTQHEPHAPDTPTASHYRTRIAKWETLRSNGTAYFLVITRPLNENPTTTIMDPASVPDLVDDVIGFGGINAVSTTPQGKRIADIGVLIDSSQWRKGYGQEAMRATIDFAFRSVEEGGVGCDEVFFETLAVNEPFLGLVERMGLGKWKRVVREGREVEVRFGKGEWEGVRGGL